MYEHKSGDRLPATTAPPPARAGAADGSLRNIAAEKASDLLDRSTPITRCLSTSQGRTNPSALQTSSIFSDIATQGSVGAHAAYREPEGARAPNVTDTGPSRPASPAESLPREVEAGDGHAIRQFLEQGVDDEPWLLGCGMQSELVERRKKVRCPMEVHSALGRLTESRSSSASSTGYWARSSGGRLGRP